MLEWLWPWVFAVAPVPFIVHRLSRGESLQPSALRAPFAARWRSLSTTGSPVRSGRGYWWLLWLAWMMLVTAIARPQWIGEPIELPNTGRDLMLGLDLSGSMQIEDMQIGNRLVPRITAVKAIAADFTQRRQGDRVGLILFGTRAYLQAPLTFDLSTVTRFIDEAQLGFAGEDTAIGDALGLAIKRLKERPASSRIFILLTDGQDTASTVDPMEAAALAAQLNVKIYTIGISRNLGRATAGRNEVDEAMLNAVAEATGGRYFRARSPAELEAVYALLDELEPVEQEASTFRPKRALSWIPLLAALGLASLLAILRSNWLPRLIMNPRFGRST
jgi:Ca-activated chloride channel family protein